MLQLSNVIFFIYPPLLCWLFVPYSRTVAPACHLAWGLLILVGISSAYFHSTLSLAGQLADEFSIIWVFSAALGLWLPKRYQTLSCRNNRFFTLRRHLVDSTVAFSFIRQHCSWNRTSCEKIPKPFHIMH